MTFKNDGQVTVSFRPNLDLLEEVDRRALEAGRTRSMEIMRAIARDYAREALGG